MIYRLLTILSLLLFCCGCDITKDSDQKFKDETATNLPTGSTNIELAGNGWVTFEWKGCRFLYRRISTPTSATTETCVMLGPVTQATNQSSSEIPMLKLEDLQKK